MRQTIIVNLQNSYRREELEGRVHLVVNGVIVVDDAILPGSEGPFLYPGELNARKKDDWNGMPIVVNHPRKGKKFTTARTKQAINNQKVGVILNSEHNGKLAVEFWFDEERTKKIDKRLHENILNHVPTEVSTGIEEVEFDPTPGELNGNKFVGTIVNYRADHVAVLLDQKGACSIEMGAGLFANQQTERANSGDLVQLKDVPESAGLVLARSVQAKLDEVGSSVLANELSFGEVEAQLCTALASEYGEKGRYWDGYVVQVFPKVVIFAQPEPSAGRGYQLYSVGYTASDSGVSLDGKAVPVIKSFRYTTKDGTTVVNQASAPTPAQETSQMAFDKTAHVNGLIANNVFPETDRAWLMEQTDDRLQRLKVPTPVSPPPPPVQVVANQETEKKKVIVNLEDLDPTVRKMVQRGLAAEERQKEGFIDRIMKHPGNKFKKETLANMDLDDLAAMAELTTPATPAEGDGRFLNGWQPDFSGMAPAHQTIANAKDLDEPLVEPFE